MSQLRYYRHLRLPAMAQILIPPLICKMEMIIVSTSNSSPKFISVKYFRQHQANRIWWSINDSYYLGQFLPIVTREKWTWQQGTPEGEGSVEHGSTELLLAHKLQARGGMAGLCLQRRQRLPPEGLGSKHSVQRARPLTLIWHLTCLSSIDLPLPECNSMKWDIFQCYVYWNIPEEHLTQSICIHQLSGKGNEEVKLREILYFIFFPFSSSIPPSSFLPLRWEEHVYRGDREKWREKIVTRDILRWDRRMEPSPTFKASSFIQ